MVVAFDFLSEGRWLNSTLSFSISIKWVLETYILYAAVQVTLAHSTSHVMKLPWGNGNNFEQNQTFFHLHHSKKFCCITCTVRGFYACTIGPCSSPVDDTVYS